MKNSSIDSKSEKFLTLEISEEDINVLTSLFDALYKMAKSHMKELLKADFKGGAIENDN